MSQLWLYLPLFALSWPIYVIPESSESPPNTQCQSWTLWLHPEPTRVLATHSWILWLPCILSTHSRFDAYSTFPLPRIKSIPDTHTHSWPDTYSTFSLSCVKSIPNISLVSWLWSGEARSCTSLAQYVLVHLSSLSIYLFLSCPLYVPLSHHSLPSFCFSVSSSVPCLRPPSFHLSLFYPSVDPTLLFHIYLTTHSQSFRSTRSLPHPTLV